MTKLCGQDKLLRGLEEETGQLCTEKVSDPTSIEQMSICFALVMFENTVFGESFWDLPSFCYGWGKDLQDSVYVSLQIKLQLVLLGVLLGLDYLPRLTFLNSDRKYYRGW